MRDLFDDIGDIIETEETVIFTVSDNDKDEFNKNLKLFEFALRKIKTVSDDDLVFYQDPDDPSLEETTVRTYINFFSSYFFRFNVKVKFSSTELIEKLIIVVSDKYPNADLNFVDTSELKSLDYMFAHKKFNGNISMWDVSHVESADSAFESSEFNGDISKWDVSHVKNFSRFFRNSKFNGDISKWDLSNAKCMDEMFYNSMFRGDISNWNVTNCESFYFAFCSDTDISLEPEKLKNMWIPDLHKWIICGHFTNYDTLFGYASAYIMCNKKKYMPTIIWDDMPASFYDAPLYVLNLRKKELYDYYHGLCEQLEHNMENKKLTALYIVQLNGVLDIISKLHYTIMQKM